MKNKGFTLVELIITLAIMSLILLVTVPMITDALDKGKNKSYDILKENMKSAAENYLVECRNNISSPVCTSQNWNNTTFTFTAIELLNNGFLTVPSDLVKSNNTGKTIYNPSTKKDIGTCLKINVNIENYKYNYIVNDEECYE